VRDAVAHADRFFSAALGARAPRSLRLTHLAEALLQPPRVPQLLGEELVEPEFVERAPYEAFTQEQREAAADILERVGSEPIRLSPLLMQALGHSPQAAHCLALHVLHAYHPQLAKLARAGGGVELVAYPDGRKLPANIITAVDSDSFVRLMGSRCAGGAASQTPNNPFSGDDLLVVRVQVSAAEQGLAA
jgi:hypothetical protein